MNDATDRPDTRDAEPAKIPQSDPPAVGDARGWPWWQEAECPSWCTWSGDHLHHELPDDRTHYSGAHSAEERILLTLSEDLFRDETGAIDRNDHPCLDMYLKQGWREVEARIVMSVNERTGIELTLSEADRLREVLNRLLLAASRG